MLYAVSPYAVLYTRSLLANIKFTPLATVVSTDSTQKQPLAELYSDAARSCVIVLYNGPLSSIQQNLLASALSSLKSANTFLLDSLDLHNYHNANLAPPHLSYLRTSTATPLAFTPLEQPCLLQSFSAPLLAAATQQQTSAYAVIGASSPHYTYESIACFDKVLEELSSTNPTLSKLFTSFLQLSEKAKKQQFDALSSKAGTAMIPSLHYYT